MKKIFDAIKRQYFELDDVFSGTEAWFLFRTAAFLETFGWSLLIFGIVWKRALLPAYEFVLPIAGSTHGFFFIIYIFIVFFTHRSLGWSFKRFVVAEAIVNVPFAALIFERWIAGKRQQK